MRAVDQHVSTLSFETTVVPLPPSFMMSYACRVRQGDEVAFSGWRQTSTITLRGATPLIYTGPANERIDVLFIADEGTYSNPFGSAFHTDIVELIRNGFYDFPLYGGLGTIIGERFNFWLAEDMGDIHPNADNACGAFTLEKPATWKDFYAFADEGIIVHRRPGFRDCAQLGVHSVEMDNAAHRVVRHEAGHRPFGLADEYCSVDGTTGELICDGGYFQTRSVPNLYRTLRACENDAADLNRTAANCRTFTSTHPLGRMWFTSEPQPADLMFDNTVPRAADIRRILWMYQRCTEGKC